MNDLCTIYLVRHGKTDWNDKKLIQGHTDIPLSAEGIVAAKELAQELKKIKFDKIYSSDLLRAKQTAEIIALEHQLEVETAQALRERSFGSFEGRPHESLKEIDSILERLDVEERVAYTHNGAMESDKEMMGRFITFMREISLLNAGRTILVTTHAGIIRSFLVKLGFLEYDPNHKRRIDNLAFVKLESDGVDFFIKETSGIEKQEAV